MIETIGHRKNPLTVIAILAGLAEVSGNFMPDGSQLMPDLRFSISMLIRGRDYQTACWRE
jgi:hypothetical protein